MKTFAVILAVTGCAFLPLAVLAATAPATTSANPCVSTTQPDGTVQAGNLPQCVAQVYKWSLGIGTLLALLMTVIGGYYIMTSRGNAEQSSRGKEMITGAIIGLVLLFCAYLILYTINPDLTSLRFDVSGLNSASSTTNPAPTAPLQ